MRSTKCPWCSRTDVEITDKGGLAPHVDAAGKKCIGVGAQVAKPLRTEPKPIKGITQRNRRPR